MVGFDAVTVPPPINNPNDEKSEEEVTSTIERFTKQAKNSGWE